MNWYKTAKIGEKALTNLDNFPQNLVEGTAEYLHSLPDNAQSYLWKQIKKILKHKQSISLEEIKAIPVQIENDIEINPKMEQYVKNITNDKKERQWLRSLISIGRVKEEDIYKISNLFAKFHNLPDIPENNKKITKITDFKDDSELSKYIDDKTPKTSVDPNSLPKGAKLLESFNSMGQNFQLYNLTTQEALDAVGKGANWCVLTENGAYNYEPLDYYCFVIDGNPEVLIHQRSSQIKDSHDATVADPHLIKNINPYIEKYKLNTHDDDFAEYDDNLANLKTFESKINDEEFINEAINEDIAMFSLIPNEYWDKYTKTLIDSIITESKVDIDEYDNAPVYDVPTNPFDKLNYSILEQIGKYIILNNEKEFKNIMDNYLEEWMNNLGRNEELSVGRYQKKVPPTLKNKEIFNKCYQKMLTDKKAFYMKYPTYFEECKIKELINDPDIQQAHVNHYKDLIRKGDIGDTFGGMRSMPQEALNDPEPWRTLLSREPRFWKKCPIEEVKMEPKIFEKAKQYYMDIVEKAGSNDNRLKTIPKEFQIDVLSPDLWERKIYKDPLLAWEDCPVEEVKNDPEIISFVKKAWKDHIGRMGTWYVASEWKTCPFEDVKNDPEVLEKARNASIIEMKKYPPYYKNVPFEDIRNNQDLWDEILSMEGNAIHLTKDDIPYEYKSPKAWKNALINSPFYYDKCPLKEITNDPEVVQAYVKYFQRNKGMQLEHRAMPHEEQFKQNPELLRQFLIIAKKDILNDTLSYKIYCSRQTQNLANILLNDPEIKESIIQYYIEYPKELWRAEDWIENDIRVQKSKNNYDDTEANALKKEMESQQSQSQPQVNQENETTAKTTAKTTANTNSRLWSSAFNDNFIGII